MTTKQILKKGTEGFFALALLILNGCYEASDYVGDGSLTDNGSRSATDRYVLDLGAIDLTRESIFTYSIENLPEVNFVSGILLSFNESSTQSIDRKEVDADLAMTLTDQEGRVVFSNRAELGAWIWSVASGSPQVFAYGRDEQSTYFDAAKGSKYELVIAVIEPDTSDSSYVASVRMSSGGWK